MSHHINIVMDNKVRGWIVQVSCHNISVVVGGGGLEGRVVDVEDSPHQSVPCRSCLSNRKKHCALSAVVVALY